MWTMTIAYRAKHRLDAVNYLQALVTRRSSSQYLQSRICPMRINGMTSSQRHDSPPGLYWTEERLARIRLGYELYSMMEKIVTLMVQLIREVRDRPTQ